jgi:hypothetical protein
MIQEVKSLDRPFIAFNLPPLPIVPPSSVQASRQKQLQENISQPRSHISEKGAGITSVASPISIINRLIGTDLRMEKHVSKQPLKCPSRQSVQCAMEGDERTLKCQFSLAIPLLRALSLQTRSKEPSNQRRCSASLLATQHHHSAKKLPS